MTWVRTPRDELPHVPASHSRNEDVLRAGRRAVRGGAPRRCHVIER